MNHKAIGTLAVATWIHESPILTVTVFAVLFGSPAAVTRSAEKTGLAPP